jgi:hypothetical protein
LVLGRAMGKLRFTRLTTTWPWDQHPNVILSRDSQMGLPQFWGPITLRADFRLRWGLKQSCSPCQELFNGISHATFTQGNQGDSWLLVLRSQIANLTPNFSFGPNLCFRCPNGLCKPILDIYVLKAFQWYKKLFNPLGFDPCNCSLKI